MPTFARRVIALVTLCLSVLCTACDSASEELQSEVVVEAYLEAGSPFGPVRLSRTAAIDRRYDFTAAAVSNAEIELGRVGSSGQIVDVRTYIELPDQPGVYRTFGQDIVQPLATYELYVVIRQTGEEVRSRTTVPGDFSIIDARPDTVEYQGPVQVEVVMSRSSYPGRQAIFVFSTESLDPSIGALTPFYREVVEPDMDADDDELDEFLINESPPLNEDGYQVDDMGNLRIKVPWLAFAFYGPNQVRTNAIDDNLFDFVRSQRIQQGGSTLAPGEIPNAIDHIEGGIGVFGSYARVATNVFVRRPPN